MRPLELQTSKDNGRSDPLLNTHDSNRTSKCSFLKQWWNESAWPGMGLFGESYMLFSIGTLRPIWDYLYPECFVMEETCSSTLLKSLSFSVVLGVIFGMLAVGTLANTLGRRCGSITTASFMSFGACGLLFVSLVMTNNAPLLVVSMSCLLFVFGIGVGGEYPLSASSASERAMGVMKRKMALELKREEEQGRQVQVSSEISQSMDNKQQSLQELGSEEVVVEDEQFGRGKRVQLVFTMQGLGIFANTISLTVLLWLANVFGNTNDDFYSSSTLLSVWRVTYAVGAMIIAFVLVSRIQHLTESQVWKDDKERRERLNRDAKSDTCAETPEQSWFDYSNLQLGTINKDLLESPTMLLFRNYGWRLFGTSMSWLLWDIAFYGNKLFQSDFLLALTGNETTLLELSAALALNAFVALLGYLCAAVLLDHPRVGRVRLQLYGFLLTGFLFCCCGFFHETLSSGWLVCFYLGSSFFGQVGPNATTFLIPAEVFPTEMRTMCHGIAAACGKAGALLAAVVFSHVQDARCLFFWSGYASFVACILTFLTLPDTTTLDLYEIDRKWRMTLAGKQDEYEGEANNPEHLSFLERRQLRL